MANGYLYIFLILCGPAAAGGSNINCKFDILWDNGRAISDLVATKIAKAQTHESTLTNCGASAMWHGGLIALEENSMLFMRNSFHFMKHI
uniref:Uncharacterized protein n=1 Tax=Wuchereria bancrofti TaxID=6293 RepID=A0AAF5Q5U2_WUCBA